MIDTMELARRVQSMDEEGAKKEIFNILKQDQTSLVEILKSYAGMVVDDVLTIKHIVAEYNNVEEAIEEAIIQEEDLVE